MAKKYKETLLERLDNWLYDNSNLYAFFWRLWKNQLSPVVNYYRLKRLGQRLFWGFDDSETWALDSTFYRWLYPRLKRFIKVMQAYPTEYKSFENWKKTLTTKLLQLEDIITKDELEFDDWSYIPTQELKELKAKEKQNKTDLTITINQIAYHYSVVNFNEWFAKNINNLWW